jgi:hypothetical protein
MRDILGPLTVPVLIQYLSFREQQQDMNLDHDTPDQLLWRWCSSGHNSSKVSLFGYVPWPSRGARGKRSMKDQGPNEYQFLLWLAMQNRYWTVERLHRHGMHSDSTCALCDQQPKSIDHLLFACVFSRHVWFTFLGKFGLQLLSPGLNDVFPEWWIRRLKQVAKARRKAFDSLCALVTRCIWLHRNDVVFRNGSVSVPSVIFILDIHLCRWVQAGPVSWLHLSGE